MPHTPRYHLILLLLCSGLLTPALAASFDCKVAHRPIEQAICSDAELSALDDKLATTYRTVLHSQGDKDAADDVKKDQRRWLATEQKQFDTPALLQNHTKLDQLKALYRQRLQDLHAMPVFPTASQPVQGPVFFMDHIARHYNFTLRMLNPCPIDNRYDESTCEGSGQVLVYKKSSRQLVQTISMTTIFVTLTQNHQPLTNSAKMYDYQGVINVGDFNFDGSEDFAIQNGNQGSYGGPSYDVYLFDSTTQQFVYNDAMSGLIQETLGFFDVDPAKKVIRTMGKSGCCYHEFTTYRVEKNTPVPIHRVTEEAQDEHKVKVTEETLTNGKWRTKVHYEKM